MRSDAIEGVSSIRRLDRRSVTKVEIARSRSLVLDGPKTDASGIRPSRVSVFQTDAEWTLHDCRIFIFTLSFKQICRNPTNSSVDSIRSGAPGVTRWSEVSQLQLPSGACGCCCCCRSANHGLFVSHCLDVRSLQHVSSCSSSSPQHFRWIPPVRSSLQQQQQQQQWCVPSGTVPSRGATASSRHRTFASFSLAIDSESSSATTTTIPASSNDDQDGQRGSRHPKQHSSCRRGIDEESNLHVL